MYMYAYAEEVNYPMTSQSSSQGFLLLPFPPQDVLESCSVTSIRNSVVAGYAAGVVGTLVGHPLDSVKVWMQTRPCRMVVGQSRPLEIPIASGSFHQHHYSTILRRLYAGVQGPLVTVGVVQSLHFGLYDSVRRILHNHQDHHPQQDSRIRHLPDSYLHSDSLWNVGIASFVAGSVLSVFTSPLIQIKTQQQIQPGSLSFRQALVAVARQPQSVWVGFGPHFVTETCGRAIYFISYEGLKRTLMARHNISSSDQTHFPSHHVPERMVSAAMAGILSWSLIYPFDSLKSRLYASSRSSVESTSTWDVARAIYRQWGWKGFFRGYGVTVLRAGPVAATVLPLYDVTLEYLSAGTL